MPDFSKISKLSKQIAASILKGEQSAAIEDSEIFNKKDKAYILKNLTDESLVKERLAIANQIDKNADWKNVKSKTSTPVIKRYWRYVAAAAVFIGILASSYFFKNNNFDPPVETTPIIVDNSIKIGTDKATLTLEDGTIVTLEKGTAFKTKNANSNGEQIVYDTIEKKATSKVAYHNLTIPRGGQYLLKLSDGTDVWLNSESQLKYPVNFKDGETRKVELVYGEAYFDVSPSINHKGAGFKVYHNNHEIHVLGTEFNIKAYKDETHIYTTLVEGKVEINFKSHKRYLTPNQRSNINTESNSIEVNTVDVYNEISWKDGVFSFEDKPLKDIMKVLSRWYDMDVVFKNTNLQNEAFNGILGKDQNIEDILSSIKSFGIIKAYNIKDKKVILE